MDMKQMFLLLFLILLLFVRCDTTEPPTSKATLTLTLEDVSCTEAWIKLTTSNLPLPANVVLKQNEMPRATINLTTNDTLLYIDTLLPKQNYVYQVSGIGNPVSSNAITATTLDTTSHNFTWQTFTFGQHSSSLLYDVAIINENNIWAVGEIYMNDSLGQPDPNAYNAVHWDGSEWKLQRIYTYSSCNAVDYAPLRAIWAFSDTNIVVTSGGSIGWFNGTTNKSDCSIRPLLTGSINKLWGSTSIDLYAVGDGGNIAHYNSSSWTKIESGTSSIINDIWGIVTENNETIAYCPVSSFWIPGDKKLLSIKGNYVDSIPWTFNRLLYSVWTPSESVIYVCGGGIFERRNNQWKEINITSVAVNRVRGNYLNDIFAAGDFGFIAHFNGITWNIEEYDFNSGYGGLSVKGKTAAVVGQRNGRALIKVGKRY